MICAQDNIHTTCNVCNNDVYQNNYFSLTDHLETKIEPHILTQLDHDTILHTTTQDILDKFQINIQSITNHNTLITLWTLALKDALLQQPHKHFNNAALIAYLADTLDQTDTDDDTLNQILTATLNAIQ